MANMHNHSRTPELNTVLTNIIKERNRLGYTQEYMGYKMGISQNAYSKIELGITNMTVNHLFKIAEIFDHPVIDLLSKAKH
jgi:transcriptional regulator with XRE-family HTH domain